MSIFTFQISNFEGELFKIEDSPSISTTRIENNLKNCTTDRIFGFRQFLWAEIRIFTPVFISVGDVYVARKIIDDLF